MVLAPVLTDVCVHNKIGEKKPPRSKLRGGDHFRPRLARLFEEVPTVSLDFCAKSRRVQPRFARRASLGLPGAQPSLARLRRRLLRGIKHASLGKGGQWLKVFDCRSHQSTRPQSAFRRSIPSRLNRPSREAPAGFNALRFAKSYDAPGLDVGVLLIDRSTSTCFHQSIAH